jgi:hypothetical protein
MIEQALAQDALSNDTCRSDQDHSCPSLSQSHAFASQCECTDHLLQDRHCVSVHWCRHRGADATLVTPRNVSIANECSRIAPLIS